MDRQDSRQLSRWVRGASAFGLSVALGVSLIGCSGEAGSDQAGMTGEGPGSTASAAAASGSPVESTNPSADPAAEVNATIRTSEGDIKVVLFGAEAPQTVSNFVGLATGQKEWTDPRTGNAQDNPLYDGTTFHRVIPDFMIQGGDPLGDGTGGPGYRFADEIVSGRNFDKPYLLAMANSGPDTNGSQFFITVAPTPWLNGMHTIFGEVSDARSRKVVDKIVSVPTGAADKPNKDVTIKSIKITEKD